MYLGIDEDSKKLSDIFNYHNLDMKDVPKLGTIKNHFTTEKYLYEFLRKKKKDSDIYLKQVSYGFIVDFKHFLRTYKNKSHRPPLLTTGS